MYILSAAQVRAWDAFTIQQEPVFSIDLMERAAARCVDWIQLQPFRDRSFRIICGKGNNGGDGLAIARMLFQKGYSVMVYVLDTEQNGSGDFQTNRQRLQQHPVSIHSIQNEKDFPSIDSNDIVVDALFGTGLTRPLQELAAALVLHINQAGALVISIDLPSGLFADQSSNGNVVIHAHSTLSFEAYKMALLVQENASFIGNVHILGIGLHPDFLETVAADRFLLTDKMIRAVFKPRNVFAHKGHFGHALLVAGSYGKIGAAVLAARALIRSGAGLLTCYLPSCGYVIMQSQVAEAMVLTDENERMLTQLPADIEKYAAIGVGPGIGTADATQKLVSFIIRSSQKPLVIDADGLNCLAAQKGLLEELPRFSILTPHPKEFDRLFGTHESDFDRIHKAQAKARELQIVIILKSHHTLIATPDGELFFNTTGNSGMAKGGSGDVLTGIITALLAQGYQSSHAALLGVYLHGLAGDFAANALSKEAMIPTDIVTFLPQAFRQIGMNDE